MWNVLIIVMVLFLVNPTHAESWVEIVRVKGQGSKRGSDHTLWSAQSGTIFLARDDHTDTAEPNQSGQEEEDKQKETKKENDSTEEGEKKEPLKEFEPSEKIDAEKAVDFPADI